MIKNIQKISLKISRREVDKRLDAALLSLLTEKFPKEKLPSRATLSQLAKKGKIAVNGVPAKPHYLLHHGDVVGVSSDIFKKKTLRFPKASALSIEIVFENDNFLVVNKPAGLLVHPVGHTPKKTEETLAHFLVTHNPAIKRVGDDRLRPGIVHRLDQETSGLLVVAKNQKTFLLLKQLFQKRLVKKVYLALVYGHLEPMRGSITAPLLQRSGKLRRAFITPSTLIEDIPDKARAAVTHYQVTRRYPDYDLVKVIPKTGRTHQIRVHLASMGHPVVGDKLYAYRSHTRDKRLPLQNVSRHMLHALELTFQLAHETFSFAAPLPADFASILQRIDESRGASYDDEALKSSGLG